MKYHVPALLVVMVISAILGSGPVAGAAAFFGYLVSTVVSEHVLKEHGKKTSGTTADVKTGGREVK